jgi:5-deoxy-glucuronate isomerase
LSPVAGPGRVLDVTPSTAGWRYLSFAVVAVTAGSPFDDRRPGQETAIVTLSGSGRVVLDGVAHEIGRSSVFAELGRIVYVTAGAAFRVESDSSLVVAVGSAPADGVVASRVVETTEMRSEIRGGGQAYRQVVHSLAHPLEAERLIVYEVYVPRGTWAGWPPHRHDGVDGAPYLEETYYFRLDRPEGYALHRNFNDGAAPDGASPSFDEVAVARDGDLVLVPMGYHTTVSSPGSNMYFLNFLAGDLVGDERRTPPCFHADHTWIEADWTAGAWDLPVLPTTH